MARMFKDAPVKLIRILPGGDPVPGRSPFARTLILLKLELAVAAARGRMTRVAERCRHIGAWAAGSRAIGRELQGRFGPRCAAVWKALSFAVRICLVCVAAAARRLKATSKRGLAVVRPQLVRAGRAFMERARCLTRWLVDQAQSMRTSGGGDAQALDLVRELIALREQVAAQQRELAQVTAQVRELKGIVLSQQQVLIEFGKELDRGSTQVPPVNRIDTRKAKRRAPRPAKPPHGVIAAPTEPAFVGV